MIADDLQSFKMNDEGCNKMKLIIGSQNYKSVHHKPRSDLKSQVIFSKSHLVDELVFFF